MADTPPVPRELPLTETDPATVIALVTHVVSGARRIRYRLAGPAATDPPRSGLTLTIEIDT